MASPRSGASTFSVFGPDIAIAGNVKASIDLHVDGRIEGDLSCANLVQGESSEIHGAVVAESARLSGLVNGSIDARNLVIERTARIQGDVSYETLSIEQGAQIEGQFRPRAAMRGTVLPAGDAGGEKALITG